MRVYIFSLPQDLQTGRSIKDRLELKGHEVKLFDSDSKFFCGLYEKTDLPDLIVYDYLLYNHHVFNIYNYLKGEDCFIPVIFFKDPTLHPEPTYLFWKSILEMVYTEENFKWEDYEDIIKLISEETDKDSNNLKAEDNIKKSPEANENKTFLLLNELKGSPLLLFKKLRENLNTETPLIELQKLISKNNEPCRETTIFCHISRIRKTMEKFNIKEYEIIKNQNGYKMISRN